MFSGLNLKRKAFHICLGIFLIILHIMIGSTISLLLFVVLVIGIVLSMIARKKRIPVISFLLDHFDKPNDKFPGKGAFYYIASALFSFTIFEADIARASIIILALADPTAFFVGTYYGRTRLIVSAKKLLEGSLGGLIVGSLAAGIFVTMPEAIVGALFAMIVEAIELEFWHLDDNFSIPVAAGIAISVFRHFY